LCCWPCECVCTVTPFFIELATSQTFLMFHPILLLLTWFPFPFFRWLLFAFSQLVHFFSYESFAWLTFWHHPPPTEMAEDTGNGGLDFPPCLFSLSFSFFICRVECRRVVLLSPSCLCPCALFIISLPTLVYINRDVLLLLPTQPICIHAGVIAARLFLPHPIEMIKSCYSITRQQFRLGEE
jgi:hypothetical protein